jgi:6-phosphogluconolactonase
MVTKRLLFLSTALTGLIGVPTGLWAQPAGFVYVTNCGIGSACGGSSRPGDVSAYTIDGTTGVLTAVPGSPFPAGGEPASVTVDPSGQFAYVANQTSANVFAYTIDGTTGALTGATGASGLDSPGSVTVDPSGQFAYVANFSSNGTVSAFTVDQTTGALTPVPGSPFSAGRWPYSVTVDPTGQFVYTANYTHLSDGGNVAAFTIDRTTGALTPVAGAPFTAGELPRSVTVDPTGSFAYVANFTSNSVPGNVSAFTIDGTTGALTEVAGSPFIAGTGPTSLTVDPTGQFVYLSNCGSPCGSGGGTVSAFTIDGTTGALTAIPGSPFPAGPHSVMVTVDPTGQFAYVANYTNPGTVSAFTIDGTTGALTEVASSPFTAGTLPISVTTTAGPRPTTR